jgi:YD repeat-containing protein
VATTTETWDAETGSFTYDANGNLKTAPAPYSITAVTYDPANLPLSITRSGTTTTYRYDGAGQRITKQVGTGNTEVYVLDGPRALGVFTVNSSGTPTSWYFNLLAGDRVVGRQPSTGTRSYYHFDLLGSTRAATLSTTGAVVESYDFESSALCMPGRTLGSGTAVLSVGASVPARRSTSRTPCGNTEQRLSRRRKPSKNPLGSPTSSAESAATRRRSPRIPLAT